MSVVLISLLAPPALDARHAQVSAVTASQVESFDAAWAAIRASFVDDEISDAGWARLHEEFRPRAEAARTEFDLREVLRDLFDRIGRSHFGLLPAGTADPAARPAPRGTAEPGFHVVPAEGALVVSAVDDGSPAARAGVRTGWVLESIDGEALAPPRGPGHSAFRAWAIVIAQLRGTPGSLARTTFLTHDNQRVSLEIERTPRPGSIVTFGHLPPLVAHLERSMLTAPGGARVAYIRFNIWMTALSAPLDEAVHAARRADGVILDLRQNPGGVLTMLMGVSGHFLDSPTSLGTVRTRDSELRIVANPRRSGPAGEPVTPYSGRLAILVDETSFSASEIFAAGMQAIGRARVFGTRTPGGALPAMVRRLPNGDVIEYAIGDFVAANGRRIEGEGVVPDEAVPATRAALLAGVDAPLVAALEWVGAAGGRGSQ